MPGALMMGWLSDRVGRKRMVLACYTAGLVCVPVLAWSRSLESFWVASVLLSVLSSASAAGSALVTDSLPSHALGTGLSLMAGAANLGGFLIAPLIGLALQQLGQRDAFLVAVIVPLVSIAVFLPVRERQAV
jgi:MFS family permease